MDHLIIVNKKCPFDETVKPCLVNFGDTHIKLEKTAAIFLQRMFECARAEGIWLKLFSGHRSPAYQQTLWQQSVNELIESGMDREQAEKITERSLAKPYFSEHHTGLACDICTPECDDTQDDFDKTPQGKWLMKNAARFGFILRYPRGKEAVTGYIFEPWHYRFVGIKNAEYITAHSLTLEEYAECLAHMEERG